MPRASAPASSPDGAAERARGLRLLNCRRRSSRRSRRSRGVEGVAEPLGARQRDGLGSGCGGSAKGGDGSSDGHGRRLGVPGGGRHGRGPAWCGRWGRNRLETGPRWLCAGNEGCGCDWLLKIGRRLSSVARPRQKVVASGSVALTRGCAGQRGVSGAHPPVSRRNRTEFAVDRICGSEAACRAPPLGPPRLRERRVSAASWTAPVRFRCPAPAAVSYCVAARADPGTRSLPSRWLRPGRATGGPPGR